MTPDAVASTFRLSEGVYLLGSMERGLTLYNQQVRAHNLAWALWEREKARTCKLGKVAVIGSGAAGLTAAAALLGRYSGSVSITLFERLWDLCPLQQGSDGRWLHPRIYGWPEIGSRAPSASLPVLNWSEGRASDVARTLVRGFGEFCEEFASDPAALSVVIGLSEFQLNVGTREIRWKGTTTTRHGPFYLPGDVVSRVDHFDTVIIAAGFGVERVNEAHKTHSYWRNDQIAQSFLDGKMRKYLVSGYGDGAIVDLCRLRIERFRQDTILYELFGESLESIEEKIRNDPAGAAEADLFPYFASIESGMLQGALENLRARLRKDTSVMLHIAGRDSKVKSLEDIFGQTSSRLNRLLMYLLSRCKAFAVSTATLEQCVSQFEPEDDGVICRHGTDTKAHLRSIISDYEKVEARIEELWKVQPQTHARLWQPGAFPAPNGGVQR